MTAGRTTQERHKRTSFVCRERSRHADNNKMRSRRLRDNCINSMPSGERRAAYFISRRTARMADCSLPTTFFFPQSRVKKASGATEMNMTNFFDRLFIRWPAVGLFACNCFIVAFAAAAATSRAQLLRRCAARPPSVASSKMGFLLKNATAERICFRAAGAVRSRRRLMPDGRPSDLRARYMWMAPNDGQRRPPTVWAQMVCENAICNMHGNILTYCNTESG